MHIFEYLLVDGITHGTIVADRYELIGRRYIFFEKRFGIERQVYEIPESWVWKLDCLTCAEALGVR